MTWDEFSMLLSGIMPETPLGQIISIRSEDDPDMLKSFTKEQKKIKSDWQKKINKEIMNNEENAKAMIAQFQSMMKNAFS